MWVRTPCLHARLALIRELLQSAHEADASRWHICTASAAAELAAGFLHSKQHLHVVTYMDSHEAGQTAPAEGLCRSLCTLLTVYRETTYQHSCSFVP